MLDGPNKVGCLPTCIRRCAPLLQALLTSTLGFQPIPLTQQLLLSCNPQLHGFLQSVQLSLIWIVLQQLLLQFLLQVLQSVLESVQPVLHPLQILRLHARAASLRL